MLSNNSFGVFGGFFTCMHLVFSGTHNWDFMKISRSLSLWCYLHSGALAKEFQLLCYHCTPYFRASTGISRIIRVSLRKSFKIVNLRSYMALFCYSPLQGVLLVAWNPVSLNSVSWILSGSFVWGKMVNSTSALLSWPEAKDSTYSWKCILEADMSIIIKDPTIGVLVIKAFTK